MSARHRRAGRRRPTPTCRRPAAEPLEWRALLSVTAASIAGPFDAAGAHWEYAATDGSGNTATLYETAAGPATYNGNAAYQVNIGPKGESPSYLALDGAGDLVDYGGLVTLPNSTDTQVYSPYEVSLPAVMTAGTPYTSSYTETDTTVHAAAGTTDHDAEADTDTTTLLSESTSPLVVPAGTYDCYHLTTVETTVTPNSDGTSTTDTTRVEGWYAADVGLVKAVAYDSDGSLTVEYDLAVFKNVNSKLVFLQNPQDVAVGDAIAPPVTVAIEDPSGRTLTGSTGSVTVSIATGAGTGTGVGKLSGTVTEPAVNGVATFRDLSVDKGGQYVLTAIDVSDNPAQPGNSSAFTVSGGKLVFKVGPHAGSTGDPLKPAVTVALEDSHNKLITDEDGTVVTLATVGVTGGATLAGNTAPLSGGVATFAGLAFKKAGTYTLQATDGGDAEATSGKFKIKGVTLKSITAAVGADKQTSTADDLDIAADNVVAVPQSNGSMSLTATGLSPATPAVLARVHWAVVRNAADVAAGATPAVTQAGPLKASVAMNGVGSFNVICYYDVDGDGAYEPGEELKVLHLAEVGVAVQPGASKEVARSDVFSVTDDGHDTNVLSGNDAAGNYALYSSETAQVIGGGADGMIGVDKVHLGFLQNGVADSVTVRYANGKTKAERLSSGKFPVLDASFARRGNYPAAAFELPPYGYASHPKVPGPTRDPVTASDPNGGQDRTVTTADSPQFGLPDRFFGAAATAVGGSNDFVAYLSAYSDDFGKTYAASLRVTWSASLAYVKPAGGTWQNTGSAVTATASILASPATLASLGVATTGRTFIELVDLR